MRGLRVLAILVGTLSLLVGGFWTVQYGLLASSMPLIVGAALLMLMAISRPVTRRRRSALSLAWFAYAGTTIASIALSVLIAAPQSSLIVLLTLLVVAVLASLRAVYLVTSNPRASLHNYYDA